MADKDVDISYDKYSKVKRKLSYKMPVTFRWGLLSGFVFGCLHAMVAKKRKYMVTHTLGLGFGAGLGLCYNDFYEIMRIY
jgi:hypothetical protein